MKIQFPDFKDATWNNTILVGFKHNKDDTQVITLRKKKKHECIVQHYQSSTTFTSADFLSFKTYVHLEKFQTSWRGIDSLRTLQVYEIEAKDEQVNNEAKVNSDDEAQVDDRDNKNKRIDEYKDGIFPRVCRNGSPLSDRFNLVKSVINREKVYTGRFILFFPRSNYYVEFFAGPMSIKEYRRIPLKPKDWYHMEMENPTRGTSLSLFLKTFSECKIKVSDIWLFKPRSAGLKDDSEEPREPSEKMDDSAKMEDETYSRSL